MMITFIRGAAASIINIKRHRLSKHGDFARACADCEVQKRMVIYLSVVSHESRYRTNEREIVTVSEFEPSCARKPSRGESIER